LIKVLKIFLLFIVITLLSIPTPTESYVSKGSVIANISFYQSKGKPTHGIYSINIESGKVSPLPSFKKLNLVSVRISPDSRYILGSSYDRKKFIRDLYLLDSKDGKSYKLTLTPPAGVSHSGKPVGSFKKYGFSPDGRWAVITFPHGVDLKPCLNACPLICSMMRPTEPSIILIDIRRWLELKKVDAIIKIPGNDFPSFSPSGRKFLVPTKPANSTRKVHLYETESEDDTVKPIFHAWQLPFTKSSQGAFASENIVYLLDGDDLVTYNLLSQKIELSRNLSGYYLASTGLTPSHMPITTGFSEGPISMGGQYYAFLMPNGYSIMDDNQSGDTEISIRNLFRQKLTLIYGDTKSPWFERMEIPPLPDKAYKQNFLYHGLFILPEHGGKQAVLYTTGWNFNAFRIINFSSREISDPIEGFFLGMNNDGTGVLYTQCGPTNDCYTANDFTWGTADGGGKDIYITLNLLRYQELKTNLDTILVEEPSYTSEAFFVR